MSEIDFTVTIPDPLPPLVVRVKDELGLEISWPVSAGSAVLEWAVDLESGPWQPITTPPVLAEDYYIGAVQIGAGTRYFRLRYEP